MNKEGANCDFCSAPGPTWAHPAKDFVAYLALSLVGESLGARAACEECHRLIEADNREGLAVRLLDELIFRWPEAVIAAPALKRQLRQLHDLFFVHRVGSAIRTAPERV